MNDVLLPKRLQGIFSWMPTPYTTEETLDIELFSDNLDKLCRSGVHVVYTAMSAAQMQTITWSEHKLLVDALVSCDSKNTAVVAGCFAPSTAEVLERIEYAADAGVDAIAVAIPYPLPLRWEEALSFLKTILTAAAGIPVIHYQTPLSGRLLSVEEYEELRKYPNLVVTKQTGIDYTTYLQLLEATPEIMHMRVDRLVPDMKRGSKGCFSAIATMNPFFMIDLYDHCVQGNWEEALSMQCRVDAFLNDLHPFIRRGFHMPSLDKSITDLAGFISAGELKRPFLPIDGKTLSDLSDVMEKHSSLLEYKGTTPSKHRQSNL